MGGREGLSCVYLSLKEKKHGNTILHHLFLLKQNLNLISQDILAGFIDNFRKLITVD